MKLTITTHEIAEMKERLQKVRRASLAATQRGDYRAVGKLTCEAAQINQLIQHTEGLILAAA
ncbi:MAG: hypothetical protein U1G07_11185 [Verrucomicrobiota bacterium]